MPSLRTVFFAPIARSTAFALPAGLLVALALSACSGGNTTDAGTDVSTNDVAALDGATDDVSTTDVTGVDAPPPPPARCRSGAAWVPGTPAFTNDQTAAWGLAAARGSNLASGDVDGDGYPDLVVISQTYNTRTNLDATPPVIYTQLYMNRPRPGGSGRMFVDATRSSNFLATREANKYGRMVNMAGFADVDNDGDLDAFTQVFIAVNLMGNTNEDGDRATVLLNDGTGVFSLAPLSAASPDLYDGIPEGSGIAFTDQNRDGFIDIFAAYHFDDFAQTGFRFITAGQQHQLFRGAGDGTFVDATTSLGLDLGISMAEILAGHGRRPLFGASACDVTGDGRQDLLGATYGRQWNLLYVNEGDSYRDESMSSGVAGDMLTDYHDDQNYLCYCEMNPGVCPANTPARDRYYPCPYRGWEPGQDDQLFRLNGNTFNLVCGDVDNDGDLDVLAGELKHSDTGSSSDETELLINQSSGDNAMFMRLPASVTGINPAGLPRYSDDAAIAVDWIDFDGDGRLDLYLGNTDYPPGTVTKLFHQNADGTFTELATSAGVHAICPHGLAVADFDLDGDVDIITGTSVARECLQLAWPSHGAEVRMYENIAGEPNWTSVRLVGGGAGKANGSAIGALVRVTSGGVTQTREVHGAYGHFAESDDLVQHFGLGANCQIDKIEVRWPDSNGTVEMFTNVVANYRLEIHQGEGFIRYQP